MASEFSIEHLARCLRALADQNRLKIVGLLAHRPHSVEELAANLHLTSATISHHLQRLQQADLVQARAQQYYNVYALNVDELRILLQDLNALDALKASTVAQLDTYSEQVLDEYFVRGRLRAFPTQLKKREVILRRLATEFETDKRYSEKRVDEILKTFSSDCGTLKRELVAMKLLTRQGGFFWRQV